MNNDELIKELRKARKKIVRYVSGLFLFFILLDLYVANTSDVVTESMLSLSPFSMLIFICLQTAIGLIFSYLEKILVAMNQSKVAERSSLKS